MTEKPTPTITLQGDNHQLVVWAEKRDQPNLDRYIAALLTFAQREIETQDAGADND